MTRSKLAGAKKAPVFGNAHAIASMREDGSTERSLKREIYYGARKKGRDIRNVGGRNRATKHYINGVGWVTTDFGEQVNAE